MRASPLEIAGYNLISISAAAWAVTALILFIGGFIDGHAPLIEALAGLAVAWFTYFLAKGASRADKHFRLSERAYVKASPVEPGVRWDGPAEGGFTVTFRIKNFGNTPAKVTDAVSNAVVIPQKWIIDELPQSVRHAFPKETKAFLVKNDEFYQHPHNAIDVGERVDVDAGTQRLIVYGYVDYIDQFGVRHRAGFGRQYLPNATANNMIFPDTGPFNYDRVREVGEGTDWD